jgi:hypothetical protein
MSSEHADLVPSTRGYDEQLVREVLDGGRGAEQAALELLLRRRPESWDQAVSLLEAVGVPSQRGLGVLAAAWRSFRRAAQKSSG